MPKEKATDTFQGLCLIDSNGSEWIGVFFDRFPLNVRQRLRESPFNLCAACVKDVASKITQEEPNEIHYFSAIESMENAIRASEQE